MILLAILPFLLNKNLFTTQILIICINFTIRLNILNATAVVVLTLIKILGSH